MYIPNTFAEDDIGRCQALMREYSFATLLTIGGGEPQLSHLPFLLDESRGSLGTLRGHMARANPQWRQLARGEQALVLFQGPHAYVSPAWYGNPVAVPTWNYANVYARGTPRMVQDDQTLLKLLQDLVRLHERRFDPPWQMQLPTEFLHQMMGNIVAFEIQITELKGKFKLSQNRSPSDRRRVIHALDYLNDPNGAAVAALMKTMPE
jgi:transcriptional regulator